MVVGVGKRSALSPLVCPPVVGDVGTGERSGSVLNELLHMDYFPFGSGSVQRHERGSDLSYPVLATIKTSGQIHFRSVTARLAQ